MTSYSDVMIDLETLSTDKDAVILAIAAVYFDPLTGDLGDSFYTNINLQSSINAGRAIDASTLIWWMQQEGLARDAVFSLNHTQPKLSEALQKFSDFFKNDSLKVWGNGAIFDISILETAFKRCKLPLPWKFWNVRDVRTVVDVGRLVGFDPKTNMPFQGVKHNALDDSKHQAKYVSEIIKAVKNLGEF
jgi:hypothetical protein